MLLKLINVDIVEKEIGICIFSNLTTLFFVILFLGLAINVSVGGHIASVQFDCAHQHEKYTTYACRHNDTQYIIQVPSFLEVGGPIV